MTWLADLFEKHLFFRRTVVTVTLWLNYDITHATKDYVMYATELGVTGTDIVLVGGMIQAPFLAVLAYTIKKYNDIRS